MLMRIDIKELRAKRTLLSPAEFCEWVNKTYSVTCTPYDFLNCTLYQIITEIQRKIKG
jgi:hypothetical protein